MSVDQEPGNEGEQNRNPRFRTPIVIDSQAYGLLQLRSLTMGTLVFLEELLPQALQARETVAQLIHHQLIEPIIDLNTVRAWEDAQLQQIAYQWAQSIESIRSKLSDDQHSFDSLVEALRAYLDEAQQKQGEMIADLVHALAPNAASTVNELGRAFIRVTDWSAQWSQQLAGVQQHFSDWFLSVGQAALAHVQPFLSTTDLLREQLEPIFHIPDVVVERFEAFTQISESVQEYINEINRSLIANVGEIIGNLPDLSELRRLYDEFRSGAQALEESEYGFSGHLWDLSFVLSLAQLDHKIRGAAITNRLAAATRRLDFRDELKRVIEESLVLQSRWTIINTALEAHCQRNYIVSIPLLLMQLEGMIGDALILKGFVVSKRKKLYRKAPDGSIAVNKKGDRIELRGLGQLLDNADFKTHEILSQTVDLLTTRLVKERNHILHGRSVTYPKAKLSTQLVLLVYIFGTEILDFERGSNP